MFYQCSCLMLATSKHHLLAQTTFVQRNTSQAKGNTIQVHVQRNPLEFWQRFTHQRFHRDSPISWAKTDLVKISQLSLPENSSEKTAPSRPFEWENNEKIMTYHPVLKHGLLENLRLSSLIFPATDTSMASSGISSQPCLINRVYSDSLHYIISI